MKLTQSLSRIVNPWLSRVLGLCVLLSLDSIAMTSRVYEADIETSNWKASPIHPLKCSLEQNIPLYGTAIFSQSAGRKPIFKLQVVQAIDKPSVGELLASPPMWLTLDQPEYKQKIKITSGNEPVNLDYQSANWMLGKLELGWEPTIVMQDWSGAVALSYTKISGVNMQGALSLYSKCLKQLLTYNFEDIQHKTIYYPNGGSLLTDDDKDYLDKVVRYIGIDKEVRMIVLKGYSDNVGTMRNNYLLAIDRLNAVQMYLKTKGINEKMLDVTAYGKRNPIANNASAKGRAKNRRVTVELKK